MFTRQNVYEIADDWADPVLWYARGIKAMQARPLDDITSWKFYGAIHGYLRVLWDIQGITTAGEAEPTQADVDTYINQCQHQSWFFLPWHRGYLLALEQLIRSEIQVLGGPHDTWALPYWNYLEVGRGQIPPAFRSPVWPDGVDDNPLFVPQRWGPMALDPTYDPATEISVNPMSDREFSGPGNGGSTGFGGPPTSFNWSGGENGGAEWQPHNIVHVRIGAQSPTDFLPLPPPNHEIPIPGLMSDPRTAALDPIFWLHHCNIDRLWESWNSFPPGKPQLNPNDWRNPSGANWNDGPAAQGDRAFAMPRPDGTQWTFAPGEMVSLEDLQYEYDDLTPGPDIPADTLSDRVARLGLDTPAAAMTGALTMTSDSSEKTVEMIGSGSGKVTLAGTMTQHSGIMLDTPSMTRLTSTLTGSVETSNLPDRVFLNLENVRSKSDAVVFKVYVGLAEGMNPTDAPENLAGTISLFGSALASDPEDLHAGNGITHVIEITDIVDRLHLASALGVNELSVDLVPAGDVPVGAEVEIGNISLYRQSQ